MKLFTASLFFIITLSAGAQSEQQSTGHSVLPPYQLPVVNFDRDSDGFYVNKPDAFYLDYMWQSFVALNWPAASGRGEPDTSNRQPAVQSPVVWETLPQAQEVFLLPSQWDNYPDWSNIPQLPAGMTVEQARELCQGFEPGRDIILYDINQPNITIKDGPVAPLIDQYGRYVRYQVTLNRTFFEYVREHEYYDAQTQLKAVMISEQAQFAQQSNPPEGAFVPLPHDQGREPGMLETKAAWRVLDPAFDDPSRYYARPGFVLNPDRKSCERAPAGVGLVALHIHRLTRLSHVAATFEQVDNVAILDPHTPANIQPSFNPGTANPVQQAIWPPYGNRGFAGNLPPVITAVDTLPPLQRRQPNNISRATPIPMAVRAVNRRFQQRYAESPLRYYQMINTQHARAECRMRETGDFSKPQQWQPVTCPQPNVGRLINAALESYTQLVNPFNDQPYNYSCQDCHAHARPCGFVTVNKNRLTFRPDFQVMSYLLSKAKFPAQAAVPDGYSCNNPATQPPR